MKVELDIFELGWLLDTCLRGSHLRSGTIERFVDDWFDLLTEQQRYNLFEWSLRITYNGAFEASDTCCGKDRIFMKRYDPENQFLVTTEYGGRKEKHRAFAMNGKYHINSYRFLADQYIIKIEKFLPDVERTIYEINAKERN